MNAMAARKYSQPSIPFHVTENPDASTMPAAYSQSFQRKLLCATMCGMSLITSVRVLTPASVVTYLAGRLGWAPKDGK